MEIREIEDGERSALRAVEADVGRARKAALVDHLGTDGPVPCDVVAVEDGRIVGQTTRSRMTRPLGWACFASLSALPEAQGRGIGGRLAEAAARFDRAESVVVPGDPSFHLRHGCPPAPPGLTSAFPVSHRLAAGRGAAVALEYPAAFS